MRITSEEITLRRLQYEDLEYMLEMKTDDQIMQYTSYGAAQPVDQIERDLKKNVAETLDHHQLGVWGAEIKETKDFLGWFMLNTQRYDVPEVGYMIRKKYWGQGLTTKTVKVLVEYGLKSLGEKRICAVTSPKNVASIRVLEKAGFSFIKTIDVEEKGSAVKLKYFEINSQDRQD